LPPYRFLPRKCSFSTRKAEKSIPSDNILSYFFGDVNTFLQKIVKKYGCPALAEQPVLRISELRFDPTVLDHIVILENR